jgi:SIR2-like domain
MPLPPSLNPLRALQRFIGRLRPAHVPDHGLPTTQFVQDIAHSLEEERLTLIVGAGLSYGNGFPTWAGLLRNLAGRLIEPEQRAAFELLSTYDNPLVSARFLKSRLGIPDMLHSFVHDALYTNDVDYDRANPTLDFVTAIVQLAHRTSKRLDIITYNFDDLLETHLANLAPSLPIQVVVSEGQNECVEASIRILHVHGLLAREHDYPTLPPPFLVLAEDDFHLLMNDQIAWQNLVQAAAFKHRDCLFIGMSMTDPNLRRVIDFSARQAERSPATSRWIVSRCYLRGDELVPGAPKMDDATASILNEIKADLYRSLGAEPLYLKGFDSYQDLTALVAARSH